MYTYTQHLHVFPRRLTYRNAAVTIYLLTYLQEQVLAKFQ